MGGVTPNPTPTRKKRTHSEKKAMNFTQTTHHQINAGEVNPQKLFDGDTPPGKTYKVDHVQNLVNVTVAGDNTVDINQSVAGFEMVPPVSQMMRSPPVNQPNGPDPYHQGNKEEMMVDTPKTVTVTPHRDKKQHQVLHETEEEDNQAVATATEETSLATDATDLLYTPTPERVRREQAEKLLSCSDTNKNMEIQRINTGNTQGVQPTCTESIRPSEIEISHLPSKAMANTTTGRASSKDGSNEKIDHNNKRNTNGKDTTVSSMIQSTIQAPRIVFHKYRYRILISLYVKGDKIQVPTSLSGKGKVLQTALRNIIRAGKAIDHTFVINAWNPENKIPSLTKEEDVDQIYLHMVRYTDIPPRSKLMVAGVCWFWGFFVSCDTTMKRLLTYWEEQRPRRADEKRVSIYQAVKQAPLQTPRWYEAGWILGSTRRQYIDTLVSKLQEELPAEHVGLHWGNIVYPGSKVHWAHAKDTFKRNRNYQEKMDLSPMALIVMVSNQSDVRPTMRHMYEHYGRLESDGMWPRFPDGSRMRYTPNYTNVKGVKGRKMFEVRVKLQIQMNWSKQLLDTNVRDPGLALECLQGSTIGEVILSQDCEEDGRKEPHFRHFSHKWSRDPDAKLWEICIHPHRYRKATMFHNTALKTHLLDEYGPETVTAFADNDQQRSYATVMGEGACDFDLEDEEDIYMTGRTKFQFQGILETVDKAQKGKSMQELQGDADDSCAYTANTQNKPSTNNMREPSTPTHTNNAQTTDNRMEVDSNNTEIGQNSNHLNTTKSSDTSTSMSTAAHGGR